MNDVEMVTDKLLKFRKNRDWEKFHNPKDLAISLILEASELLEHFQWKSEEEVKKHIREHRVDIANELADVFNWILLIAHDLNIDLIQASLKKINKNKQKYPVKKSKGKYTKWTNL